MRERYPGYDVLSKRDTPSWNDATRQVIDARLSIPREPRFFDETEWRTLIAICDRILPQPKDRPPVPLAASVDHKLSGGGGEGYRFPGMPHMNEAWRRGLKALEAEAAARHGRPFDELFAAEQDALLTAMQAGRLDGPDWGGMPSASFFKERVLHDIAGAYYAHPTGWNEIGFGGPASPRGYVRMQADRRDPWEAAEAKPGQERKAYLENRRVG